MDQELYYSLPPVFPKTGQHPRLLVVQEDLLTIKENLHHEENEKMYQEVKRLSLLDTDGILESPLPDENTNEQDEVVACAEACAFLYLLFQEEAMGKKAIRMISNYLLTLCIKEGIDPITRHTGYALYVGSCVYDWCYSLLSSEEKNFFHDHMIRHMKRLEIGWPPLGEHYITGHGTEMQTFRDLLSVGVALYDEHPEIYHAIAGRIFERMVEPKDYTNGSNLFTEGASYGVFRYQMEILSPLIFSKLTKDPVFSKDQLYVLYGGGLYHRLPDGRFIATGDSAKDSWGYLSEMSEPCFLGGNYYKDPCMRKQFFKANPKGLNKAAGRYGVSGVLHLIVNQPQVGVSSHDTLPLTAYFKNPGCAMVARTGWNEGKSTKDIVVRMNAGHHSFMNHQHSDSGHFDIYYKGLLALDSGIYSSHPYSLKGVPERSIAYGSRHDSNYHKRTIAHNCMLVYDPEESGWFDSTVNDGGQTRFDIPFTLEEASDKKFQLGHTIGYGFGPDEKKPIYSYIKGNLENAYTNKVSEYERTFVFLNLFQEEIPGVLMVMDRVVSKKAEFKKTTLLHTMEEPQINGNLTKIVRSDFGNNGRLLHETILPREAKIEKIGGFGKEFWLDGKKQMAVPKSLRQEGGRWRLEISPAKPQCEDLFLQVMQIGENDETISPLPTQLFLEKEDFLGVKVSDRVVYLRKPLEKLSKDCTLPLPEGNGPFTCVVTGLKAGTWEVKERGNTIHTAKTDELADSFCFTATGKEIELVKVSEETGNPPRHFTNFLPKENQESKIDIKIDLCYETFQHPPSIWENILYIPACEYFEKLGLSFLKEENEVTVFVKDQKITFIKDQPQAILFCGNEKTVADLSSPVKAYEDVLWIPMIEAASILSTEVSFNPNGKIATVEKVGLESDQNQVRNFTAINDLRVTVATAYWSKNQAVEGPFEEVNGHEPRAYWSAYGAGEWIEFEFTSLMPISYVELYFNKGDQRKTKFQMLLSQDRQNYQTIYSGESSGNVKGYEGYSIPKGTKAKYLKIIGHGNSQDLWNQINEFVFYK